VVVALLSPSISELAAPRPAGAQTIGDKQAEATRLTDELAAQAQRVIDADKRLRASQEAMADVQESLRQAETGVRVATVQQDEARRRLASHAIDAYTHGGAVSVLGKRLRANSDLVVYDTYLSLVAGMDQSAIEGLRGARQDLGERQAILAGLLERAEDEAGRAESEQSSLQAAQDAQQAKLGTVQGELASLVVAEQSRRLAIATAARSAPAPAPAAAAPAPLAAAAVAPVSRPAPVSGGGAPTAAPAPAPAAPMSNGDAWACIRQLESGGNYSSPGGGAYQFVDSTWQSLGYNGSAQDAPPHVQDAAAQQLQAREGWGPWPNTARMCGLL